MPKMKTHRGAAKRFKRTASGKWKRAKAFKSHLLAKKSSERKRRLRRAEVLSASDQKRMKRLLPYL
ncbi:MAG: 50S ribosomal protein L35 [Thermacetogeniaceae bacterium]|jgi:large subunit ribosomal protein L35|nr:50S ribosomal protein L35 [Thermoanaerobacterales bacterium]NLN21845.1 50S ribosomal protein L35 [Syntrophomonadaceae bacterium]HAF17355.1 50S ribosomal protein L35 [Peptococcaceae bacterium]